jgi:hypothetical protein
LPVILESVVIARGAAAPVNVCLDSVFAEATTDGASGRELEAAFEGICWQNAPQAATKIKPATRIGTVTAIAPPTTNLDGSIPHANLLSYSAHYWLLTLVMKGKSRL